MLDRHTPLGVCFAGAGCSPAADCAFDGACGRHLSDRGGARQAARRRACGKAARPLPAPPRSEEHTSELQSLMRISYAVFCLKKKNKTENKCTIIHYTDN